MFCGRIKKLTDVISAYVCVRLHSQMVPSEGCAVEGAVSQGGKEFCKQPHPALTWVPGVELGSSGFGSF